MYRSLSVKLKQYDPLDITLYSGTPLVDSNSWFQGYALQDDRDIRDLSVGILYKNIDGKDNVTWADTDTVPNNRLQQKVMPGGKIFPIGSTIRYRIQATDWTCLGVSGLQASDRVGVFTFKAKKNSVITNSAIVLTSASANVEMEYRTITVGVGESVTINLSKGGDLPDLRWRHNYNNELENLMGFNSAVIENIRRKDDGVYECYIGDSPDGDHGIMRLIIRACPSLKWNPPDCEMDCPVCYNGGVCDDKTGLCVCPAGFDGDACAHGCGNNKWGRDCNVKCASNGNCQGALLCPPDPVGCACQNGFGGNDCNTACVAGYYGADCRQECHCDNSVYDKHTGCSTGSDCLDGYTGDTCQVPPSCSSGFFGLLCNFRCHCKDSVKCNRNGSCPTGCHEAWAGPKCSIALPYRSEPPRVVNQTATTVTFDVTWISGEDYGTGTITKRKISYKSSEMDSFISLAEEDNDLFISIGNLIPNTKYQFYSQFSRMVGGIEVDGPRSVLGSTNTICSEHLEEPEIEFKTVGDNQMTVRLKPVSSDYDSIQCNSILRYQVQYSDINGHTQYVVNTTNSSQLEVELSALSSCTAYVVNARVVNNMDIAGSWGQEITVQTAPSEPSIESNPFSNGTHWLMKWKASWCDIPDYQVTYHYALSGGLFQQGTTIQTEVVFGEGIESCKDYTFTVLASYLNVNGTSDTKTTMFGIDCDQKKQGYVIGVVISSIIATVAITLMIFIRFRRIHSEKDVGKSSTTQQDISTIDTDYQSLSKKYKESEYEGIKPAVATSQPRHVYANSQQSVPEHVYGNTITN